MSIDSQHACQFSHSFPSRFEVGFHWGWIGLRVISPLHRNQFRPQRGFVEPNSHSGNLAFSSVFEVNRGFCAFSSSNLTTCLVVNVVARKTWWWQTQRVMLVALFSLEMGCVFFLGSKNACEKHVKPSDKDIEEGPGPVWGRFGPFDRTATH